jgi:hypothetical protein
MRRATRLFITVLAGVVLFFGFFRVLARYPEIELFFEVGLVGLAIVMELASSTPARTSSYFSALRVLLAVGVVIFAFIVAHKLMIIASV